MIRTGGRADQVLASSRPFWNRFHVAEADWRPVVVWHHTSEEQLQEGVLLTAVVPFSCVPFSERRAPRGGTSADDGAKIHGSRAGPGTTTNGPFDVF